MTGDSHSREEGTTRAVTWNRRYIRTSDFKLGAVIQLDSYHLDLHLLPCSVYVTEWKINVMNFFVKGDNL